MEKVNEYEQSFRGGDSGVKYLFRGPNTDWGVVLLKAGQELGGHYHAEVEETFYFVQGAPIMRVNGVDHRVVLGDAFRLTPPDQHNIINDTDDEVKIVFIKYPFRPKDKIDIS
jgi:quercetin dioxygenase-like cupin family protein